MSVIEKQLADLLSTQPKKRPPRAPGEEAKPGKGSTPSLGSLISLLKAPEASGSPSGEKTKPQAAEEPAPSNEAGKGQAKAESASPATAAPIKVSPEVQAPPPPAAQVPQPPAMQAPQPPAMQPLPPIPAMQPPPAMQPSPAAMPPPFHPEVQPPPLAMQPPPAPAEKPKQERPDIKFALQSTVTGAVSPFAKTPLPFIKGIPGAPSPESPAAPPTAEGAPRHTPAAPPKGASDLGQQNQKQQQQQKPQNLAGTVTGTVSPFARAPLPFAKAPAGSTPAAQPPAEASPKPPPSDFNATAIGSVSPFASPLPFAGGAASRDPAPPKDFAPTPAPPAVQSPKGRLDRTADELVSPFQSRALPFQKQPAAPSPPANAPRDAAPPPRAPEGPRGTWQNPAAVEPIPPSTPASSRAAPVSTRPPASSPSPASQGSASTQGLSIEQYASLCAELATYPAQHEQVFQRYRLVTAQDRTAVDSEWRARLAKDPAEYKRWHELYWQYCTYLKQRR